MHRIADRYHNRAVLLAEESESPLALGHTGFTAGMGHYYAGRWDKALASCEQSANQFLSIGHFHLWGGPKSWCAFALAAMGQPMAGAVGREIVHAGRETRDRELEAWGLLLVGMSLRQGGDYDAAILELEAAAAIFQRIPDLHDLAFVQAESALCHAHKGDFQRALELADAVLLSLCQRRPKGLWGANPQGAVAEVYVLAADEMRVDAQSKQALLTKAQRLARASVRTGKAVRGQWAPESLRLLGVCRWLAGDRKHAEILWRRAADTARSLGAKYTLAQIHLEMGRRLRSGRHMEIATDLFTAAGFSRRAAEASSQAARLNQTLDVVR
jgi:tetratricopeptide (TPR) repeat protein